MAIAGPSTLATLNLSQCSRRRSESRIPRRIRAVDQVSGRTSTTVVSTNPQKAPKDWDDSKIERLSVKDYLERSKELIRSDGGPPRWFSPLECGARWESSPLLLYLPGLDGVGLGLVSHHQRLGKFFDIWCLHIPVADRTPFKDLVLLVENTIKLEYSHSPNSPIYLIGESLGGCLALAVAARNPDIDLMLILANPGKVFSFDTVRVVAFIGDPLRMMMASMEKELPLEEAVGDLLKNLASIFNSLPVLPDILPKESILWKLQMLKSASSHANSRLHAVKAETLVLASGKDKLLPSKEEAERLYDRLTSCQIRHFNESGHTLFMEDGVDLVTIIRGAGFYRRRRSVDYVSDFIRPIPSEFAMLLESYRWINVATSPVMLSTLENKRIVRSLEGIPCSGPILFVGYHMLLGLELVPLFRKFLLEKNILLRGIAHPSLFEKSWERSILEYSRFDVCRLMGAVPVSAANFYKLMSIKSHVLLYPGGAREALHQKGEEYKLFWPMQPEFVRMAARFGAKIVPFGVVGEDDLLDVALDYDDLVKIPFFKARLESINDGRARRLRTDINGEVAQEDLRMPGLLPKLPGRFYFLFGRTFDTAGRKEELKDRDEAKKLYMELKSEVERCIAYLKEKREEDPYRSLPSRSIQLYPGDEPLEAFIHRIGGNFVKGHCHLVQASEMRSKRLNGWQGCSQMVRQFELLVLALYMSFVSKFCPLD
ncbi:hypothetical protein Syun_024578 [Stephania yunnanensis]|uniref:Serine aminopeptidase S33 domain-containing protein n=1 Tax=Stephania yunnanensis TaxID=152371 RepID=A0AAP0I4L4_9MAGN